MSETPINDLILPDPAGYNLAMADTIDRLTARVAELKAALEWYADSAHYRTRVDPYGDGRNYPAMVQLDYGEKARAALEERS